LPGLLVAGFVFSASKTKKLLSKRVRLLDKLKLITNSSVLDVDNFDSVRGSQNEFDSVITASQSKFFKLSSSQFPYLGMLERMVQSTKFFNFGNNLLMNLEGQSMEFLFSNGMEEVSKHKENNYLFSFFSRAFSRLSTSSIDIQDFSRSASATRSSVSLIACGVDHSRKSTISSNNSLESNLDGAKTPRIFLSSIMVRDDLLDTFAIQNNSSKTKIICQQ